MLHAWIIPWVLVATAGVGAVLCLLLSSSLHRMKVTALLTTVASLVAALALALRYTEVSAGLPWLCLLSIAAFLSLLGEPLHADHRSGWVTTLVLLGLGQGVLSAQDPVRLLLLAAMLGCLCHVIYRSSQRATTDAWSGLTTYGVGALSSLLALVAPAGGLTLLIAYGTLLPLFPLHGGFVGAITRSPANLPAFLVVLLPTMGFRSLMFLLPGLTGSILQTVAIMAVIGAMYGTLRAIGESRILPRIVYGAVALLSIAWWYIGRVGATPAYSEVYVMAVTLAMSGLLLTCSIIKARYGEMDTRTLRGLAYPMPRFSTLLALLVLAALGMPPFGVFAGFMGMLLHPSFTPSPSFAFIVLAWLGASWYFFELVQRLAFGRERTDGGYEDLHQRELAALLAVIMLLMALGMTPSRFFQSDMTTPFVVFSPSG